MACQVKIHIVFAASFKPRIVIYIKSIKKMYGY